MEVTSVERDGLIYAHVFRADIPVENSVRFITKDEDPLQAGIFERDAGYEVTPHRHNGRKLDLPDVGEFLWIQKGSALVTVFDEDWKTLKEITVRSGDCIVFLRGGHGVKMLETTRILEVKQGPYPGKSVEKTFRDLP